MRGNGYLWGGVISGRPATGCGYYFLQTGFIVKLRFQLIKQ